MTKPVTCTPDPATTAAVAVQTAPLSDDPAVTTPLVLPEWPASTDAALEVPRNVKVQGPTTYAFALPELVKMSVHASCPATAAHEVTLAWIRAVDVKVPNRPKTKPAIAIAAMRVMAISMTVASTGLIALRLVGGAILILIASYEEAVAEKRAFPPFARMTDPVTCTPAVAAAVPAAQTTLVLPTGMLTAAPVVPAYVAPP